MKKLLLLVVFIFNMFTLSYSQSKIKGSKERKDTVITVDFLKLKDYADTSRLWHRSTVKVRLINFNRNLYTVESSKTEANYNSDAPAIFSGIKVPGFLSISPSVKSVTADFSETPDENFIKPVKKNSNLDPSKQIPELLDEIKRRAIKLDGSAILNNDLVNVALSCGVKYDNIVAQEITLVNSYLNPFNSNSVSDLRKNLKDSVIKYSSGTLELITYLNKLISLTTDALEAKIEANKNSIDEDTACVNNIINKPAVIANCKNDIIEKTKEIKDIEKELKKIAICKAEADETAKEIKSFIKENKPNILLTNFDLINESNYVYETDVTKLKVDELTYNIKVKAEKALACNSPREKNIEIAILNRSGFKIDFSTGVFINGGNKDFMQRDYYYKAIDSSSVSIQTYDRGKRALLSIGALMHLYFRNSCKVNAGLSLGVSTTTGFDALNFHAGPSIMIGRKDRIVISGGITFKESKVLADGRELGVTYTKSDLPEAPPTVGRFPISGWFISLTYNWSKLVSKKAE